MIELTLVVFAVWRLTRMVNRENGPSLMLEQLRIAAGAERDELDQLKAVEGSLGELVICFLCLSTWLGAVAGLVYYGDILKGVGIGGMAVVLETLVERIRWIKK